MMFEIYRSYSKGVNITYYDHSIGEEKLRI